MMKVYELIQQLSVFDGSLPVEIESNSGHFSDPSGVIRVEKDCARSDSFGVVICSEGGYALNESLS